MPLYTNKLTFASPASTIYQESTKITEIDVTDDIKGTRAFLGKVHRYTRDKQLADCKAAVKAHGLPALGRSVYEHNEVADYINDLHGDEVALLPRVECLSTKKGRGVVIDFLTNVYRVDMASLRIIDIGRGISSDDADWFDYVEAMAVKIMNGRPLSKDQSALMNDMKREKREIEPGLVDSWLRQKEKRTPEFMACAVIWGNLSIKPEKKALSMLPDQELSESSTSSMRKIFGSRSECAAWLNNQP